MLYAREDKEGIGLLMNVNCILVGNKVCVNTVMFKILLLGDTEGGR